MNRRAFIVSSVAAATWRRPPVSATPPKDSAHLYPCLNEATTLAAPFQQECAAYWAAGFRRIELWFPKLTRLGLKPPDIVAILRSYELEPVSACASGASVWREQKELESQLSAYKKNLELAQALGVPRYVTFCSFEGAAKANDYKLMTDRLVRIAETAAPYKVRVAFEFIAKSGLVGSLATALNVLREAQQPNTGVCLDTFHFFAGVSKFEDLDLLRPGDIEHVHFHDVPGNIPREMLTDPDRIPPGEGVIPLNKIIAALRRIGYSGSLSTELFGANYQKEDPRVVAGRCFKALARYCS